MSANGSSNLTFTGPQLKPIAAILNALDGKGIVPWNIYTRHNGTVIIHTKENRGVDYVFPPSGGVRVDWY